MVCDLTQQVAEAMCAVGHDDVEWEMEHNGAVWLRLARAAVEAVQLAKDFGEAS
jgi:hypothetical protein